MTDPSVLPPAACKMGSFPSIALVGFMGAGKTTVGRALASRLRWRFVDVDDSIQQQEGTTIDAIFRRRGEPGFRQLEHSMIQQLIRSRSASSVIALGGGAFNSPQVQELLQSSGIPSVHLDAPVTELFRRSDQPAIVRPLRGNLDQFRALHEARLPMYRAATLTVATSGRSIAEIVDEIVGELGLQPSSGASS